MPFVRIRLNNLRRDYAKMGSQKRDSKKVSALHAGLENNSAGKSIAL